MDLDALARRHGASRRQTDGDRWHATHVAPTEPFPGAGFICVSVVAAVHISGATAVLVAGLSVLLVTVGAHIGSRIGARGLDAFAGRRVGCSGSPYVRGWRTQDTMFDVRPNQSPGI